VRSSASPVGTSPESIRRIASIRDLRHVEADLGKQHSTAKADPSPASRVGLPPRATEEMLSPTKRLLEGRKTGTAG